MALEAVQAQAGHRSIESTRIYLHLGQRLARRRVPAGRRRDRRHRRRMRADPMSARPLAAVDAPTSLGRGPLARSRRGPRSSAAAPQMAATHGRYLDQLAVSPRPATRRVASTTTLRQLRRLASPTTDPTCRSVAAGRRDATSRTTRCGSPPGPAATAHRCRTNDDRASARAAPHVLRADHRVGLRRRPDPSPDLRRRHPRRATSRSRSSSTTPPPPSSWPRLAADPNPRRRLMVELLARTGMRVRRAVRPRRRRHGPHRRHPLAARPGRQAPQRPLHPAAPPPRRAPRPTGHADADPAAIRAARRTRRRPALRPAHRPPLRRRRRQTRRRRPRPPPPAPPHPRHPSHQPGHEPRSDRRAPRPPLHADDPAPTPASPTAPSPTSTSASPTPSKPTTDQPPDADRRRGRP